jgi:hypothetical protein
VEYMLLMCGNGTYEPSPSEIEATPEYQEWARWIAERGIPERGQRLRPPAEAVTVRVRNDRTLVADGPFAETKEQIAGYVIAECADLDEAIEVAAGHPTAIGGTVEIRPFWKD